MKRLHQMFLIISLSLLILVTGCLSSSNYPEPPENYSYENETTVFQGKNLTPISEQGNFAIKGTQNIDKESYRLRIEGEVEKPANFTYEKVISYPNESKVVQLVSVDGWRFTAKWTGVPIKTLFDEVEVKERANNVIFYGVDGFSTSLKMDYLLDNDIILAYKINDVTLPPHRGFPLQVVAERKYGYIWAKWIKKIEVVDHSYRGYWESRGYNNDADVDGPNFADFDIF